MGFKDYIKELMAVSIEKTDDTTDDMAQFLPKVADQVHELELGYTAEIEDNNSFVITSPNGLYKVRLEIGDGVYTVIGTAEGEDEEILETENAIEALTTIIGYVQAISDSNAKETDIKEALNFVTEGAFSKFMAPIALAVGLTFAGGTKFVAEDKAEPLDDAYNKAKAQESKLAMAKIAATINAIGEGDIPFEGLTRLTKVITRAQEPKLEKIQSYLSDWGPEIGMKQSNAQAGQGVLTKFIPIVTTSKDSAQKESEEQIKFLEENAEEKKEDISKIRIDEIQIGDDIYFVAYPEGCNKRSMFKQLMLTIR